jgi:hypothetical protein
MSLRIVSTPPGKEYANEGENTKRKQNGEYVVHFLHLLAVAIEHTIPIAADTIGFNDLHLIYPC